MLFENYEICLYIMISCVKVVLENWMSFEYFVMYDTYKLKHLQWSSIELRSIWLELD
jgi:hypothetical protein